MAVATTKIRVRKRSGKLVTFQQNKITQAITACLVNGCGREPEEAKKSADKISDKVVKLLIRNPSDLDVEQIQDLVETTLMAVGEHEAAKQYILFRDERRRIRSELSIFRRRVTFKPYEFPDIVQFEDAINHSFWLVSEWNFIEDVQDFNVTMTPAERSAIKNALLAISQIEVAVKKFWAKLGDRFPKAEFEQLGITFAESEVRHAKAYSHLLQVLGLNDAFDNILSVPAIRARVDYLAETMAGMVSDADEEYVMTLTLFSLFIENVSLFSQFAIIKSFNKHRCLLKDVDNVVQATQQEERIHALFGMTTIKHIQRERPKWFGVAFWERLTEMCTKALDAECKIIDWIFEEGELDFLPKESVKEFVKMRLNDSIEMIGGHRPFAVDEQKLETLRWFIEEIDADVVTDFFHKRPTTYSKKTQSITASDLF